GATVRATARVKRWPGATATTSARSSAPTKAVDGAASAAGSPVARGAFDGEAGGGAGSEPQAARTRSVTSQGRTPARYHLGHAGSRRLPCYTSVVSAPCTHREVDAGRCRACGACTHEVILNRVCTTCGEVDPVVTNRPETPTIVSVDRLRRR